MLRIVLILISQTLINSILNGSYLIQNSQIDQTDVIGSANLKQLNSCISSAFAPHTTTNYSKPINWRQIMACGIANKAKAMSVGSM